MTEIITQDRFRAFAPGCTLPNALAIVPALEAGRAAVGLTTPLRVCHFLAQVAHESGGFTRLEENLSYSAERLTAVWPRRFPTIASAEPFARAPAKLAEKVYGGRTDLGNMQPGDGWRYRGRGLIQLTGRDNYRAFGFEDDPDAAAAPKAAARLALAYWGKKSLNDEADRDDIGAVTERVNGGRIGLKERAAWLAKAKRIFR